jgi:hypothetical protein
MKVNEYLPNLDAKFRFDLMHWNVSNGPKKLPIFGRFLTLFPLKRPARREKNTSNMADVTGKRVFMPKGGVPPPPTKIIPTAELLSIICVTACISIFQKSLPGLKK